MNYWEAIARLATAEDEVREARLQLGEGDLSKTTACLNYARDMINHVAASIAERGIVPVQRK